MPVSSNVLFECQQCGYKEMRTLGDVRPDLNELKPCPRCGSRMIISPSKSESIVEKIKRVFHK